MPSRDSHRLRAVRQERGNPVTDAAAIRAVGRAARIEKENTERQRATARQIGKFIRQGRGGR